MVIEECEHSQPRRPFAFFRDHLSWENESFAKKRLEEHTTETDPCKYDLDEQLHPAPYLYPRSFEAQSPAGGSM